MNLMCPPWYFEMYENRSRRRQQQQQQQSAAAQAASSRTSASRRSNGSDKPPADGFNHEEMGMTSERQRVIQASLFKMLGQAEEDEKPAAETNGATES